MELKEFTIKELLSNYKLVIPEIQREYVWGSNKTVLEKFLSELNESLAVSEYSGALEITEKSNICDLKKQLETTLTKVNNVYETNIGFLYSYDAGNDEHYIIDGQQRLTTIVLLLFFYSVKEDKKSDFINLLNTSRTLMNFSYRVRPLTEQFLITLFNDENITEESFKNLKDSKWYVSDYDGDTTITSICKLYECLSTKCIEKEFQNLNYNSLLNRVKFYYFDVQQTSQGEELYITMNSRGEQLKDNEQIKPYILEQFKDRAGRLKAAKEWEGWEEYFFERLPSKDEENVKNVDVAIENIIKIALELKTCSEHNKINAVENSKDISFEDIKDIYERISELIKSTNAEINNFEIISFLFSKDRKGKERNLFAIEAIVRMLQLGYMLENENDTKNIHRMVRLIQNSLNYGVMNHVPLLNFLKNLTKNDNIYNCIVDLPVEKINGVFINQNNKEELYKIQAMIGKIEETVMEYAENLPIFNGKIHVLCRDSNSTKPNWETFHKKLDNLKAYLSDSTEQVFKSEQHVEFISNFINSFTYWGQLYKGIFGKTFLNNKSFKEWESLLTDNKFIIPLSTVLLQKEPTSAWIDDENTKILWEELKDNISLIIEYIPNGKIDWNNKYCKFVLQGNGKIIIFDWKDFHRNSILEKAEKIEIPSENRFGTLFCGEGISFTFNGKKYIWHGTGEIEYKENKKNFTGKDFQELEKFLEENFKG